MASYNIVAKIAPTLSNLQVFNTLGGANLEWDASHGIDNGWGTEVWFSATNDRSTATLVTTVKSANTYFWQDDGGATGYFWIRSINGFGYNNGAWEPTGSTSGVALSVPTVSISPTTSVSSASSSGTGALTNAVPSSWNTWTSRGYYQFTVPSSGSGNILGHIAFFDTFSAITGAGGSETTKVKIRFRLYNVTDSVYVDGEEFYYYCQTGIGNTTLGSTQITNHNYSYRYGAVGNLILNKTYKLEVDISKNRSASGATLTVTGNGVASSNTANAIG